MLQRPNERGVREYRRLMFQFRTVAGTKVGWVEADEVLEDGGLEMSYTNGLGNLHQLFGTSDIGAAGKSSATSKTGPGSMSSIGQNSSSTAIGGDHAEVSAAAGLVSQALTGSDVRFEKVAALQQSIAAGTYGVSSSDVADKLMGALLN
jgi:negative regulator of flagellin synthesis FlgM